MKPVLITSSILILLIAALRPILRGRIDPRIQYALWLIVALRLLVPVNLAQSAYSVPALLERRAESTRVVEAIGQTALPIPAMSPQNAMIQAYQEYGEYKQPGDTATRWDPDERVMDRAQELMRGPTLAELAAKYAKPVWLGGAALMAAWFLLVNLRLRRKLARVEFIEVEPVSKLPVFVSGVLPSPCLCGAFRPAIYVTPAAADDPQRLRHVLAHESTHYRHRDHWWALVRCLCLCLYWFDPLAWWAAAMSRQDCELACDAGAIRRLGEEERLPYGRTLVNMISSGHSSLFQTATTMTGGKRRVKERVKLIARKPKTVIALALALVLVLGLAVGCTFTGAPEKKDPTPMNLPAETLQERLLDLPEELRPTVKASASDTKWAVNDIALASYWWDVPAEWESERSTWLLDVHRLERNGETYYDLLDGWFAYNDDCVASLIAQDEEFYYVIERPLDTRFRMEDSEPFTAACQAIRAYAEQQVLDTEGVESFTLDADTLRERLNTIPENLQGEVVPYRADAPETGESDTLASYFLDNAAPDWGNWLLTVCQWDRAGFENWLYHLETGTYDVFARDSEYYYAFMRPTSVEYDYADAERYAAAFQAIHDYAEQQVLDTQGVEPYDPSELRSREYLWEGKTYTDVAYWPYKNINGDTDIVWILRLVQLAKDGEDGVWIPERYQIIDEEHGVDPTPQHIRPSDIAGLTVTEYAAQLQAEADAGRADWAFDPIQVCLHFTDFVHSTATVDSFTRDSSYIESILSGTPPTPAQQAVSAAMENIIAAPSLELSLGPAGTSRLYPYPIPSLEEWDESQGYWAHSLGRLPTNFAWEYLGETIRDFPEGDTLRIWAMDGSFVQVIQVWSDSNIMLIQRTSGDSAETAYYEAKNLNEKDAPLGVFFLNPGPYQILRGWFDLVELTVLRVTSVPNRGQSHEDVVREWLEGFAPYTKCASGSQYACTYVRVQDVKADAHAWMEWEGLEDFARSNGFTGEDYGKTWFSFSFSLVFVPENQNAEQYFLAGNTTDYTESDAPEGAQIFYRVGYMQLIDGNWVCEGVGTGW